MAWWGILKFKTVANPYGENVSNLKVFKEGERAHLKREEGRGAGEGKWEEIKYEQIQRGRREDMQKYVKGQEWEPFLAGIPEF